MTGAALFVGVPMFASAAPTFRSGVTSDPSPAISGLCTVTVQYGVAPFTYLWSQVSGDPINIQTPTSVSTRFSGALSGLGDELNGVFKCTVTDASGLVADTNDVTVNLSWV